MTCSCIEDIDKKLAERNTRLAQTIIFSKPAYATVTLVTEIIERKRGARPVVMLPTFCPFCGERYVPADSPVAPKGAIR